MPKRAKRTVPAGEFLKKRIHKIGEKPIKVPLGFENLKKVILRKRKIGFLLKDLSPEAIKKLQNLGWVITQLKSGEKVIFRPPKEKPKVYRLESLITRELRDEDILELFMKGFDAFPEENVNIYTVSRFISNGWTVKEIEGEKCLVAPEELWKIEAEKIQIKKDFKLDEKTRRFLEAVRRKLDETVKAKENRHITLEECENELRRIIHNVLPQIGLDPRRKVFPLRELTPDQREALKILKFAFKGKEGWGKEHEPRYVNLWYAFEE